MQKVDKNIGELNNFEKKEVAKLKREAAKIPTLTEAEKARINALDKDKLLEWGKNTKIK